jgi:predicted dehydrogenase
LQYDAAKDLPSVIAFKPAAKRAAVRVGVIGAGSYARKFLLPNFKANGVEFVTIATASGLSARDLGGQYGFASCVSGAEQVLNDDNVNLVVIATRHDSHAELARAALLRGKHVFVEKPLALNDAELDSVLEAANNSPGHLLVGFNRRFSPLARLAHEFFAKRQAPLSILYRVNAGRIPREHWIQDPAQGGRIVGEVCHFVDLIHFLAGSVTTRVYAEAVAGRNHEIVAEDSIFATLRLADGSNASIAYLAEGDKSVPKERVEIYGEGKTFILDDFRRASLYQNGKETVKRLSNQDKGQAEEVRAACAMAREGGPSPITLADLAATTRATFRLRESLRTGEALSV